MCVPMRLNVKPSGKPLSENVSSIVGPVLPFTSGQMIAAVTALPVPLKAWLLANVAVAPSIAVSFSSAIVMATLLALVLPLLNVSLMLSAAVAIVANAKAISRR